MCECLRARFHITVSATVNCMQPSPVRAIHSDFAARIPRQRYNGHWKLKKPLFLLHARCSYVSGLSLHSRHPLKGNRELSRIWREGERERKRWNREGRSEKVKSLLFLCPAPVARPLLPPTSRACWTRSTKAACVFVHAIVCFWRLECVCLHVFWRRADMSLLSCQRMLRGTLKFVRNHLTLVQRKRLTGGWKLQA